MFVNQVYENIWKDRYQKNGETLTKQYERVANFIAQTENEEVRDVWKNNFFTVMNQGLFYPAGRTMSNAAVGESLTLNNCFVAPIIDDSMEGIFDAVKLGAVTHKAGGGIGYSFSNLSPSGRVTSNKAVASGAISFMDVFNAQTATVQQGSRRGANMGMMSVYHPDILDFIHVKSQSTNKLNHFNLSVVVDDDFMLAVVKDYYIWLHWPIYKNGVKTTQEQWDSQFTKKIKAREIWDEIMRMAYDNGEPGIFFEDTANKKNPAYYAENIVCSNPCAEYLAGTIISNKKSLDYSQYGGACNLGSLFLHNFVEKPFTKNAYFSTDKLSYVIKVAVRMLDDIIDVNHFPDKIYENYQKSMRTIGIGITGLADMLAMLGLKYDSLEARNYVENLMRMIANAEYQASVDLAKEKGAFPFCEPKKHASSLYCLDNIEKSIRDEIAIYGIRNAKIQAVAPCGTISMVYGNNCSSGIEPIFSLSYDRKVKIGGQEDDDIQIVKMMDYAYYLYHQKKKCGRQIDYAEDEIFPTALNISVDDHINMLSIISKYTDMSVSKTINVPTEATLEEVKNIYIKCWKKGVKGCTIFRPNAIRQGILLTDSNKSENIESVPKGVSLPRGTIIDCSNDLIGKKRKLTTGCGSLHVVGFFDPVNGELQECYLSKGSTGGCQNFMIGLSRMISLLCRAGVDIYTIKDQLDSTGSCPSYAVRRATHKDTSKGSCCPMAIGNALIDMYEEMRDEVVFDDETVNDNKLTDTQETQPIAKCPECGEPITFEGGCNICKSCGWTKCG